MADDPTPTPAAESAEPATSPIPDSGANPSVDADIEAILGRDPFASTAEDIGSSEPADAKTPGEGEEAPKADGEPSPKAGAASEPSEKEGEKPPGEQPSEEPDAAARLKAAAEAAKPDEAAAFRERIAKLEGQLAAVTAPAQPADTAAAKTAEIANQYPVQVPDQYMDALFPGLEAEQREPARQVLGHLVQSIAVSVHQRVAEHVAREVSESVQTRTQETTTVQARQEQVRDDFYGKFPQLKTFGPTVSAEAQKLQGELGGKAPWTPDFRDALGARVLQALALAGFVPKPNGAEQPAPQARPGARPGAPATSPEDATSNDILSTLG